MDWRPVFVTGLQWHAIAIASLFVLGLYAGHTPHVWAWRAIRRWFWISILLLPVHLLGLKVITDAMGLQSGFPSGTEWMAAGRDNISDPQVWAARSVELDLIAEKGAQAQEDARRENAIISEANRERSAQLCRADAECYSTEAWADAQAQCAQKIESDATYGIRWENGFFEDRFLTVDWSDQVNGVVLLKGNLARMENAYGTWGKAEYQCSYSIPGRQVIWALAAIRD